MADARLPVPLPFGINSLVPLRRGIPARKLLSRPKARRCPSLRSNLERPVQERLRPPALYTHIEVRQHLPSLNASAGTGPKECQEPLALVCDSNSWTVSQALSFRDLLLENTASGQAGIASYIASKIWKGVGRGDDYGSFLNLLIVSIV